MRRGSRIFLAAALAAVWLPCACSKPAAGGPQPAPTVKLQLMQAPQAELNGWNDLRGKLVVLEFWATWCDSCAAELPHLNEVAARLQGRPVQFLFVTTDSERQVRDFLKTHQMRGWVGLDTDGSAFAAFGVRGLPLAAILDPQGGVVGETYPQLITADRLETLLSGARPGKS
jgi:thiol-disulfide isomerase/thioredoxin